MEELRIDPTIAYDVVELPSQGIYYPTNKKSVRVSYLNATDEDILSSPNFLATNTVIEELLKRKILDRDLPIEDLVEEDRQAILIFLRNTAWGTTYTVTLVDPKTDKEFKTELDLSVLKTKDFNLKANSDGEYSYYMEKSKVEVTFKFLTRKQEKEIEGIKDSWNGVGAPPVISKKIEMMIKSIQGNKDLMNIRNFVQKLPIKDSQDFRKFVDDNKPGVDLTQTTTTPSGENIQVQVGFGVEFFRPFYGI
jgi:hypothetical protein